ncbi:hypothetical protein SAMN05216298_0421 [Glycomyces sambucus]|uniref:Uncharacterized protein n=1 Tax=Glycomyces sambucus TaxID=380244 RepID=A0A1G9CMI0_9ACTN|nr:hypothetical protein SAMN05216298_0421 [Glycomyces sambucus]
MVLLRKLMSGNEFIHRQHLDHIVDVVPVDLRESYALVALHMPS